jgi:exosortase A-associated hydrolase 2
MPAEVFFLPVTPGQRFCVFHPALGVAPRGLVLYVHPFAEEMNKSRRMAAMQSRALARAGYSVLQMDLLGCGDSSGDFADARWAAWIDDVVHASAWLRQRGVSDGATCDSAPLWLWGLRAGSLLCCQAAMQIHEACHFMFWQPPVSGKLLLRQFLRIKLAADILDRGASSALQELHAALDAGNPVEVAGYTVTSELACGLENAALKPPKNGAGTRQVRWLEVSALSPPEFQRLPDDALATWEREGYEVDRRVIAGTAFWLSSEPQENSDLIAMTTEWFQGKGSA